MDTKKIGQFLSTLRKEKNLTQEQLGEILHVTNKTISRWENGTYLPPVESLQQLSDFYGLTINEILSGEKLPPDSYQEKAEENIKSVLKTSPFTMKEHVDFFRRKWFKDHLFSLILEMILLIAALLACTFWFRDWMPLAIIADFVWIIVKRNQMMAYVEGHIYKKYPVT